MTEEEKKQKFKNIVYRLKVINNKIENLNNSISTLNEKTKQSILIDEKVYNSEVLGNMIDNLNGAYLSIKDNIIPDLNRDIYN